MTITKPPLGRLERVDLREAWLADATTAPKFNRVRKTNDWSKTVRDSASSGGQTGQVSPTQQLHIGFWTQFRQYMQDRKSAIRLGRPSQDSWATVAVGRANFALI